MPELNFSNGGDHEVKLDLEQSLLKAGFVDCGMENGYRVYDRYLLDGQVHQTISVALNCDEIEATPDSHLFKALVPASLDGTDCTLFQQDCNTMQRAITGAPKPPESNEPSRLTTEIANLDSVNDALLESARLKARSMTKTQLTTLLLQSGQEVRTNEKHMQLVERAAPLLLKT